jgi:hypothetical protein
MPGQLPLALLAALPLGARGLGRGELRPKLMSYTPSTDPDENVTEIQGQPPVDCQATPWMCAGPFDCDKEALADLKKLTKRVATKDGRPNPKSWCADSRFWGSTVKECLVDGEPKRAAASRLAYQLNRGADDEDAKYCFLGEHCAISEIDENTTAEEAEAVCSRKYGDKWKSTGLQAFYTNLMKNEHDYSYNFLDGSMVEARKRVSAKSRIACAQGSFHCDVVYCKEHYCNNPAYREVYAKYITWEVHEEKVVPGTDTETPPANASSNEESLLQSRP